MAGGAIIVSINNTDIWTVNDLKGKKILANTPNSISGFQSQARIMQNANMSVYTDPAGVCRGRNREGS